MTNQKKYASFEVQFQDESGDVSGNVLGDATAESFYGSAVTSQKSKTEVTRVRFGRRNLEFLDMEREPLYPERFPVNSTHRGGGTLGNEQRWDSSVAADNNKYGDEDSTTMVSRQKSLKSIWAFGGGSYRQRSMRRVQYWVMSKNFCKVWSVRRMN